MKIIAQILYCVLAFSMLNAQDIAKSKSVSVAVSMENGKDRKVTLITKQDGQEKEIEWTDQGEIPEDIRKQLLEEGIDVKILEEDGENLFIELEDDDIEVEKEIEIRKKIGSDEDGLIWIEDGGNVKIVEDKAYKVIIKDDAGSQQNIEWDGEGEMPEAIKELLEEHDIDLDEIHEDHGSHRIRMSRSGEDYKIIRPGKNSQEIFIGRNEESRAKVFFGARVEDSSEGAKVVEVMEDSPAAQAKIMEGDVVTKINGARTRNIDGFLKLLHHFDPGDQVIITILRSGTSEDLELVFKSRPEDFR